MKYIWKTAHGQSILVDTKTEAQAWESFLDIIEEYFPETRAIDWMLKVPG